MDMYRKAYNESCQVSAMVYGEVNKAFEKYFPNEYGYWPGEDNAYKFCCIRAMEEVIDGILKRGVYGT